jgi:hypothetical protein
MHVHVLNCGKRVSWKQNMKRAHSGVSATYIEVRKKGCRAHRNMKRAHSGVSALVTCINHYVCMLVHAACKIRSFITCF